MIGVGGPPNSLLASSAHATISTILGPDLHGARRPRPVPDARQGSGAPAGGPTAPLTIETRETKVCTRFFSHENLVILCEKSAKKKCSE